MERVVQRDIRRWVVTLRTLWIEERIDYDGSQISAAWAHERFGLVGDHILGFIGACDVQPRHMVDLEDRAAGAVIRSERMIHFLAGHADGDLTRAILRQRLLAAVTAEEIGRRAGIRVERRHSDLFVDGRKLNVSVATRAASSTRIHFGINVVAPADVGVATAGVAEWGIDPSELGRALLERCAGEEAALERDRWKVRAVR